MQIPWAAQPERPIQEVWVGRRHVCFNELYRLLTLSRWPRTSFKKQRFQCHKQLTHLLAWPSAPPPKDTAQGIQKTRVLHLQVESSFGAVGMPFPIPAQHTKSQQEWPLKGRDVHSSKPIVADGN